MKTDDAIDILLVEDNPDDTELTTHALSEGNNGLLLHHLKDGVEALKYIFEKKKGCFVLQLYWTKYSSTCRQFILVITAQRNNLSPHNIIV